MSVVRFCPLATQNPQDHRQFQYGPFSLGKYFTSCIQIKEALARKPGATLKVNEIVDDSIVVELEKEGFIDRIYK